MAFPPSRKGLAFHHRSSGLMRQSQTLRLPVAMPRSTGLCRLLSVPAGSGTFPTLSLRIFSCVLGPLPRLLLWCIYPFLPTRLRPSPRSERVGAWHLFRAATSARPRITGLQSFSNVQAHRFARHSGRSYYKVPWHPGQPWLFHPSISRFVTSPCPGYASRPNRAIDGRGFSPHKIRSLVGCSQIVSPSLHES